MNTFQHVKKIGSTPGTLANMYRLSKPMKIKGQNCAVVTILSTTETYQAEPEIGQLKRMISYVLPGDEKPGHMQNINLDEALKVEGLKQSVILNVHGYWESS